MARNKYHTSTAAIFAVAAELSRKGYNVGFTVGNRPRFDLFCGVPDGESFKIQVKGISNANGLYVQESFFTARPQDNLFIIIVLVPKPEEPEDCPFRFFILSHEDARREAENMPHFARD